MKLGKIVENLCREKGWTVARLSREAGVPQQTLHNWSTARGSVNPEQARKVASALGASLHFLFFGEPDPNEAPGQEILKEIFSGDVRVTLHRIERRRK